jgi:hypothetical protein
MKTAAEIDKAIADLRVAIERAEAEIRPRTKAATVYAYWLPPPPDVPRLRAILDALLWVRG